MIDVDDEKGREPLNSEESDSVIETENTVISAQEMEKETAPPEELLFPLAEEQQDRPGALAGAGKSRQARKKAWPYKVFIVIGLLMLFSPLIGKVYGYYQDKQLMENWADENDTTITPRLDELEDAFTESQTQNEPDEQAGQAEPVTPAIVYKPTIIGSITIPKLDLTRPIADNDTKRDLRVAICKIPGSSGIGQPGNCSLAGHRNYAYKEFFDNIDKLAVGDKIILKNNKGTYTYEVYDKFVTTADDVSVLTIRKSETIVTLITCHPKYIDTDRLIVKAKLIDAVEKTE